VSNNSVIKLDFGRLDPDGAYVDDGCPMHPKCLECPLPCCIYDLELSDNALHGYYTKAKLFPLIEQTGSAKELAIASGMNVRTAFRMRKMYQAADGNYVKFIDFPGDEDVSS